jgi:hypothetical protein
MQINATPLPGEILMFRRPRPHVLPQHSRIRAGTRTHGRLHLAEWCARKLHRASQPPTSNKLKRCAGRPEAGRAHDTRQATMQTHVEGGWVMWLLAGSCGWASKVLRTICGDARQHNVTDATSAQNEVQVCSSPAGALHITAAEMQQAHCSRVQSRGSRCTILLSGLLASLV